MWTAENRPRYNRDTLRYPSDLADEEWAMRQGWGGRPVRIEQAQGILVATLGVLAGYYRYGRR